MRAFVGGSWPVLFLALGLLEGCRCTGGTVGPCDQDPPAVTGCNQDCTITPDNCPAGLYCGADSQCTADCSADVACMMGETCTPDGRCVASSGDGSTGDGSTTGDGGTDSNVCADISLTTQQVVPSVITIVDQSGSMGWDLAGSPTPISRWDALEKALVGDRNAYDSGAMTGGSGLIYDWQDRVRFGVAFYTTQEVNGTNECTYVEAFVPDPLSTVVVNDYPNIKAEYDMRQPLGRTPTATAIANVRTSVLSMSPPEPVVFILATDGAPNCGDSGDSKMDVITEVQTTYAAGIETYVISLSGDDADLNAHLDDVADAGIGAVVGSGTGMKSVPTDYNALVTSLETIIGNQTSCDLTTNNGTIVLANACMGTVRLNGNTLACDDADGWTAVNETTIRLQGAACAELKGTPNSMVQATFPCAAATCTEFCGL